MNALVLINELDGAGVTLYIDGETLKAAPSSSIDDSMRSAIRKNKEALIKALSVTSTYWLIGDATLVTYAPQATFQTVKADYPGQLVAPLTDDQWRAFE
jgi:TubC N-terminal docking domain